MALPGFKHTTNMRSIILDASVRLAFIRLEEKYPTKRLDDLASISSGGTPSRSESTFYDGDIPWAKIGDITAAGKWISDTQEYITKSAIELSSAKLFPIGTVFFSMYGSIGKTSIAKRPMTTNQAILGLVPADDISSEFLYYALINARESLFAQSKGTSQKNINGGMVKNFEIPVPPADEQKKVVEFLSLVEDGEETENLKNLPEYLLETRRIVAHIESLARRVNEAQQLRDKADDEAEKLFGANLESVFQSLLKKHETMPLIELVEPERGISYGVVLLGEDQADGIPTLRAGDLKQYRVSTTNLKKIAPQIAEKFKRTKLLGNELLLKIRGGYGDVAVCPQELINGNVSREIAVIPLLDLLIPEYGMYVLSAPTSQERMSSKLRGTSYQGLNLSDVRKLPIPVPPLDEQRRIVAYLDGLQAKVNVLRELQSASGEELSALMPSILDKAFKGEL